MSKTATQVEITTRDLDNKLKTFTVNVHDCDELAYQIALAYRQRLVVSVNHNGDNDEFKGVWLKAATVLDKMYKYDKLNPERREVMARYLSDEEWEAYDKETYKIAMELGVDLPPVKRGA